MKSLLKRIHQMTFMELLIWELWILGFAGFIIAILGFTGVIDWIRSVI